MFVTRRVGKVENDFSRIGAQIERMFALCDSETFLIRSNGVSGWSVGAQLDHLSRAGTEIVKGLEGVAQTGGFVEHRTELPATLIGRALLRLAWFPRGVAKAPKSVVPEESPTVEDVRGRLEAMAVAVVALEQKAEILGVSRTRRKHPRFGGLTATQWVRFIFVHQRHHLKIVRDILAVEPGFKLEPQPKD